jgi:hypothetical protein
MKNLILLLFLIIGLYSNGQVPTTSPYPNVPAAAANIDKYTFYVDTVNSATNQIVAFAPATSHTNASQIVNLPGVQAGVHQLYVKVTNAVGVSSIYNLGNFYKEASGYNYPNAPTAAVNIDKYTFYVDTVNSTTNQSVAFTPATSHTNASQIVNLPGVQAGVHQLYAKITNIDGVSSIYNLGNFYKEGPGYSYPNAPATAANIDKYTFYVDTINSSTNQTVTFTPATSHTNASQIVNLPGVQAGVHQLYAKITNIDGVSSIYNLGNFYKEGVGYNYPNAPIAAPPINEMEFFVDTDPGFGLGTPISITSGTTVNLSNILIPIDANLTVGQHKFYIRCKQNPWSINSTVNFEKLNTLPVSWLYVKGQLINNSNEISWATSSEQNTSTFEIEHSQNGINFTNIGSISAAGNSTTPKHYKFNHFSFVKGANYYRVKQIDNDRNFKYSTIVKLFNNNDIKNSTIVTNPVQNVLQLVEPNVKFIKSIIIYSIDGDLKLNREINSQVSTYNLPIQNFASGNYILKIIYSNSSTSIPFMKQ